MGLWLENANQLQKKLLNWSSLQKEWRKSIGLLTFLSKYLPRHNLIELFKLYVRPDLEYGNVIYHIPAIVCGYDEGTLCPSIKVERKSSRYGFWINTYNLLDLTIFPMTEVLTQLLLYGEKDLSNDVNRKMVYYFAVDINCSVPLIHM